MESLYLSCFCEVPSPIVVADSRSIKSYLFDSDIYIIHTHIYDKKWWDTIEKIQLKSLGELLHQDKTIT